MTVRSNELTSGAARTFLSRTAGTAFYRLALMTGAVLFLVAAICQPSVSAPINYGNFMGSTVTYTQVTEDALSAGDSPPLFGMPTVSANALLFNPIGFKATAANGSTDITDGELAFGITAKPMNGITSITLGEAGDTTLAGIGTDATSTAVFANIFLDITEVDFVPLVTPILQLPFAMTFTPSGGTFGLGTDGLGGPFFNTSWNGQSVMNLGPILTAHGIPFVKGATKVSITLDNTLLATSQANPNTNSLIAKKKFGGLSVTVNEPGGPFIPEPSTMILAGVGLLGMLIGRRARNG